MHVKSEIELFEEYESKFLEWMMLKPVDLNDYIIRRNVRDHDRIFRIFKNRCNGPGCLYPLPEVGNFRIPFVGDVCNLCYFLYSAVHNRIYFVDLHREWEERKKGRWK